MDDLQKMASELTAECIAVQKEIGDERLFIQVASVLGASSQTLEEAFLTNVRTKMAAEKARAFLVETLGVHGASTDTNPHT
jgi:hypothetical protein